MKRLFWFDRKHLSLKSNTTHTQWWKQNASRNLSWAVKAEFRRNKSFHMKWLMLVESWAVMEHQWHLTGGSADRSVNDAAETSAQQNITHVFCSSEEHQCIHKLRPFRDSSSSAKKQKAACEQTGSGSTSASALQRWLKRRQSVPLSNQQFPLFLL